MSERLQKRHPEYKIVELPSVTYFLQIPTTEDGAIDSDAEWTLKVMPGGAHDAREAYQPLFKEGHLRDEQYGVTQEVGGFLGTCLGIGALHINRKGDAFRMRITKDVVGQMRDGSVLDEKSAGGVTYTLTTRWSALHGTEPTYTAILTKTSKNEYGNTKNLQQIICHTRGAVATGCIHADLAYRRLKYSADGPEVCT